MNTPGLIAVCLVSCCLACNTETALVHESDLSSPAMRNDVTMLSPSENLSAQRDPCIAFNTTYWLYASGKYEAPRTFAPKEGELDRGQAGMYILEADGDAISDLYARGHSEMQLILNAATHAMTVEMTTRFFNGEELELTVDGVAQVKSDEQAMELAVAIGRASLRIGEDVYDLDYGNIIFILPSTPEGVFNMNASAFMQVCLDR